MDTHGTNEFHYERISAPSPEVEAKLRHRMLDHALDAFIAIDGYSVIRVWSRQAETLFGWPAEDVVGQSLTELLLPERYRAAHEDALRRYRGREAQEPVHRRMEVCALHRDGHEIPVELSLSEIEVDGVPYFSAALRDISEWRRMEENLGHKTRELEQSRAALRQQRDILTAVLDSIAEAVTVADQHKRIILRNRAAEALLGIAPDKAGDMSTRLYTLYHPETLQPLSDPERPMYRAIRGLATDNVLMMVRPPGHPDGITLCANGRPLKNSRGELIGGVVVFRDVTEQQTREQALREGEAHFRSLMENAQGYFIYRLARDPQAPYGLRVVLLGQTSEEILGLPDPTRFADWFTGIHPDDQARMREANQRCCLQGAPFNEQYRWFHPVRREWRWLHSIASPVQPAPEDGTLYNGLTIDITARKNGEEAMRRLAAILEATTDLVSFATPEGKILYMNPAGLKLLGRNGVDEVVGTYANAYFADALEPMWRNAAMPAALREGSWSGETVLVNRQGEEIPVSQVVLAHKNAAGEVEYLSTIVRDIRAQKRMEASLRELSAHQQAVREEERKRIAREIHDDLGGSLTAIKMEISMCRNAMRDVPEFPLAKADDVLRIVDCAATSLRRIIDDLRPSVLDTLGLWAAVEWQAEAFQARTGIACEVAIDGREREVDADRATAVFRIFQEALTNVYRHAGATRVRVGVRLRATEAEVVIQDNGRGIRAEDTRKRKSYGLLGMRERARQFGIGLRVQRNREGTAVSLSFPVESA